MAKVQNEYILTSKEIIYRYVASLNSFLILEALDFPEF